MKSRGGWTTDQEEYLWHLTDRYPLKMAWRRYQAKARLENWPNRSYQAIAQKSERLISVGRHSQGFNSDWLTIPQFSEIVEINLKRLERLLKDGLPIRRHGTKKGARRYIVKRDLNEWLAWNKNINVFIAYSPSIQGIEEWLDPAILARVKRADKQFTRTQQKRRPVKLRATGEVFDSVLTAARQQLTSRSAIVRSAETGLPSRVGDIWQFV